MKPIVIHNPHDTRSVAFVAYLRTKGIDFCLLNWYSDNTHPRELDLTYRLINMHLTGAMEGLAPAEPEVVFTDEEVAAGDYPREFDRWIMTCECHAGEGYEGPPLRAMPSVILDMGNNELGLWDLLLPIDRGEVSELTPEEMWEMVLQPEWMQVKVKRGECLAGQWIDSAIACASSPHWSNNVIRTGVDRFIKKYMTLKIAEPDKVLIRAKGIGDES